MKKQKLIRLTLAKVQEIVLANAAGRLVKIEGVPDGCVASGCRLDPVSGIPETRDNRDELVIGLLHADFPEVPPLQRSPELPITIAVADKD